MTPRDLRNIHSTENSCRDILSCMTWRSNYPSIFTCWWRNLLVLTFNFSATRKHQRLYPQGDRPSLKKAKKGWASTLITTTTSTHLPKPISTNVTIKSDLVLTNSIGKDGMRGWSMRCTFSFWGKTNPAGQQPSISMSQAKKS